VFDEAPGPFRRNLLPGHGFALDDLQLPSVQSLDDTRADGNKSAAEKTHLPMHALRARGVPGSECDYCWEPTRPSGRYRLAESAAFVKSLKRYLSGAFSGPWRRVDRIVQVGE
jgi:hypothetical protein